MCQSDYDDCALFSVRAVRARKRHRCDECACPILPGEDYARASWLSDDGAWGSSLRCAQCFFLCDAIETLICGDHGTIPWGGGWLREELDELGVLHSRTRTEEYTRDFAWAGELFDFVKYRRLEMR